MLSASGDRKANPRIMNINFRVCTESDLARVREYTISLYQEDPPGKEMNAAKFDRTFWEFTNKPEKGRIVVFDRAERITTGSRDNLVVG
jgi:hypothetical protein